MNKKPRETEHFGLNPSKPHPKALFLASILPVLPPYPDDAHMPDYSSAFPSPPYAWGAQGNDSIGDCVPAFEAHAIMQTTGARGCATVLLENDTVQCYTEVAGYVRGQPNTDHGTDVTTALEHWRKVGFPMLVTKDKVTGAFTPHGRDKLTAYAEIYPTNKDYFRAGYYIFEVLGICAALPWSTKGQLIWDVVPNDGGMRGLHCMSVMTINAVGPVVNTWGNRKQITWAWYDRYVNEVIVPLTSNALQKDTLLTNSGFSLDALNQYLTTVSQH